MDAGFRHGWRNAHRSKSSPKGWYAWLVTAFSGTGDGCLLLSGCSCHAPLDVQSAAKQVPQRTGHATRWTGGNCSVRGRRRRRRQSGICPRPRAQRIDSPRRQRRATRSTSPQTVPGVPRPRPRSPLHACGRAKKHVVNIRCGRIFDNSNRNAAEIRIGFENHSR